MLYDVVIIGAGVTGAAVARELSKYELRVCVLERNEDVCTGTSKANSAIVHAGYDARPGSMMARMNLRGNELMEELAEELDVPFHRNGSYVVCTDKREREGLLALYERGITNGVKGLEVLSAEEARRKEPNLSDQADCVLYAPTAGIVCPFMLTIGLAENASQNGVEFRFNHEVVSIGTAAEDGEETGGSCSRTGSGNREHVWSIRTGQGEIRARYIVNAAGVYADVFHNMVSDRKIHITPRKGEYLLLDKEVGDYVRHTIFTQPTKMGKGILVAPTIHGNLIVGPTAADGDDKENIATTREGLDKVTAGAGRSVKTPPLGKVITSFAGLRAHEDGGDFILGPAPGAERFLDCAGIESPGLTAAPAIGEYIGNLLKELLKAERKKEWTGKRRGILDPSALSLQERNDLIRKNPAYGILVCRCESVTEGEIIDAIQRPLGARSLDGVKRRVRAGSGRCQGGFCMTRVMEILHRELGIDREEVTKCGGASRILPERR